MKVQKFISNENENISNFKQGDIVKGKIINIKPYGAFVKTEDGIVGLLHVEDISVARIKTPFERFTLNEDVNVVVKKVDEIQNRLEFSYKEMFGTWEENVKNITEGTVIHGIIRETEKNKKGIFIELKPNLIGMAEYTEGFQFGQNVEVMVKKINKDKKKIKLIIK